MIICYLIPHHEKSTIYRSCDLYFNVFSACEQQNTRVDKRATTQSPTQENFNDIAWKSYNKNYSTLAGIRYPAQFYFDDTKGYITMSSSPVPLCIYATQCTGDGLEISIAMTKRWSKVKYVDAEAYSYPDPDGDGIHEIPLVEPTMYPHIEKVKEPNTMTPEFYVGYNYQEYVFSQKEERYSYIIRIIERNYQGNSTLIIDGILSSLHEE